LSKSCQKNVKKLSKSRQKVVKKYQKVVKKLSKNLSGEEEEVEEEEGEEEEGEEEEDWWLLDQVATSSHLVTRGVNKIPYVSKRHVLGYSDLTKHFSRKCIGYNS
jgi:hypothetical protein